MSFTRIKLQSDTADALMSPPPSPVDKRTGRASLL